MAMLIFLGCHHHILRVLSAGAWYDEASLEQLLTLFIYNLELLHRHTPWSLTDVLVMFKGNCELA